MVVAASVAAVVVARGGGGGDGGGFCLRRAELHEQRAEVVVQRHALGVCVGLLLARGAEERQRARAREGLLPPPPRPLAAPHRVERRAAMHILRDAVEEVDHGAGVGRAAAGVGGASPLHVK